MPSNEEQVRAAIAEQAAEWLVANDAGRLDGRESVALVAWLQASPVHVEEFLGVSALAHDLRAAAADPEYSLATVLAHARLEDDAPVQRLWPRLSAPVSGVSARRWLTAAASMAAIAALSVGWFTLRNVAPVSGVPAAAAPVALHFETRHGEQLSRRLADNSVVHLNTDSAVTVRFSSTERLITLTYGQAEFEVAHEPQRAFRVLAGAAEVVAIGTKFDVYVQRDATVVTVVEGRVAVAPSPRLAKPGTNSQPSRFVTVGADQQIRVAADEWPAPPTTVDAQRATSWLRHEIVFDHEPLARVAAEFNRYAPKSIEIATPALRNLEISGRFATDDTDAFVAFVRTLKGVRVEVTATHIRVSQQ